MIWPGKAAAMCQHRHLRAVAPEVRRLSRFRAAPPVAGWLIGCLILAMPGADASAAGDDGDARRDVVVSLIEQRQARVVMQSWDYSCGAASLATLLNFQHGDPVTEREIAVGLMAREEYVANPILVNLRQGFSLADLKLYVDARGYNGRGLGRLDLDSLVERAPALVPIKVNGSSHFVVFRGQRGNRVLLADPLFGNRTMTVDQFLAAWPEDADLGRIGFVVERKDGLPPPNRLKPSTDDFLTFG
jgi:predicted double-glycine peptidase